jgi:hypothetical protein
LYSIDYSKNKHNKSSQKSLNCYTHQLFVIISGHQSVECQYKMSYGTKLTELVPNESGCGMETHLLPIHAWSLGLMITPEGGE